jgi:hypothetical protein
MRELSGTTSVRETRARSAPHTDCTHTLAIRTSPQPRRRILPDIGRTLLGLFTPRDDYVMEQGQ